MQSLKNRLVSFLLKKDKLVAVPTTWQAEYIKLAADKNKNRLVVIDLMNAYNDLLLDYYNKSSAKELREELATANKKPGANTAKEELVKMCYEEFKMTIERN